MADIFFSYARIDKARVAPIVQLLTAQGWTVWWDPAILPGDVYRNLIDTELTTAKCVVVAWSDTSVNSDWVRDEAEKGKVTNKLIPILLDDVEQPLGFRQIHALNFVGLNYRPDHPSAQQLIAAVRRKIEASTAPNIASPSPQMSLPTPVTTSASNAAKQDLADVLLGLAIDTSGSMSESIRNDTGRVMSRLEGIQEAIREMGASIQSQMKAQQKASHSIKLFAYAFGLRHGDVCDLISMVRASKELDIAAEVERLKQKYEAEGRRSSAQYGDLANLARNYGFGGYVDQAISAATDHIKSRIAGEVGGLLLHKAQELGDSMLSPQELVALLDGSGGAQFKDLEPLIFGSTPMLSATKQLIARFSRLSDSVQNKKSSWLPNPFRSNTQKNAEAQRVLLVVSDGESTDGDPLPNFKELRGMGVTVVSCFVTNSDIADPRTLVGQRGDRWSAGATLMWNAASELDVNSPFAEYIANNGWKVQSGAKLFLQANHSTVISEFIRIAGTYFGGGGSNLPAKGV